MADIKDVKEVAAFALSLAKSVEDMLDNGFQWTDVFSLIPPFTKLPDAIEGYENIPEQLLDMDAAEKKELTDFIDSLDLKSDRAEELTEQSLKAFTEIVTLAFMVRESKKPAA